MPWNIISNFRLPFSYDYFNFTPSLNYLTTMITKSKSNFRLNDTKCVKLVLNHIIIVSIQYNRCFKRIRNAWRKRINWNLSKELDENLVATAPVISHRYPVTELTCLVIDFERILTRQRNKILNFRLCISKRELWLFYLTNSGRNKDASINIFRRWERWLYK